MARARAILRAMVTATVVGVAGLMAGGGGGGGGNSASTTGRPTVTALSAQAALGDKIFADV